MELHGTVGPARTTVAEIARKAGVQRLTVYTHFPDLTSLFAACTTHWFGEHPPPDGDAGRGRPTPHPGCTRLLVPSTPTTPPTGRCSRTGCVTLS
ncbi:MAG TPA: helix-turn-helix domain-containing protein [Dehalococcoidia bacterium]|nr:helix-turn-helix domain-containing protein [Dehalococcoidia bacterium]